MAAISILMPTYNGMAYLEEAIESILAQDFTDWELLISDDGSTDGTVQYLRALSDRRITLYTHDANMGIFRNLNFLLKSANCEIAKIMCQDDLLLPGGLLAIFSFMRERPDCVVSRCWSRGDGKLRQAGEQFALEGELPAFLPASVTDLAFATFGNIIGNLCQAACRPEAVLALGGFDQNLPYAGDYEGWSRVARRHGVYLQNAEWVFRRTHAEQASKFLNKRNQLYPQLNVILGLLTKDATNQEKSLLTSHWTRNLFTQRVSRSLRHLVRGHFNLAMEPTENLPRGITRIRILFWYPFWKFRSRLTTAPTRRLLDIIKLKAEIEQR